MKHRLIFASLAILAIVSCSKKEIIEDRDQSAPDITASIINDSPNVKTSISVDKEGVGTIWWQPGDKVNIFFGNTSVPYTSTNAEPATTVVFTTTAMIGSTESASTNRWGLYPYDENATCDGSSVTTTVPSLQYAVPETFDNNTFTMLGHSTDNMMTFYNVCGGIKFSLSRDDIQKITFKGNNNENIAGKVKLEMDSDNRPKATVVEGQKTVILLPKSGTTFAKNTNYYIVSLPVSMANGFTMTFETENSLGVFKYGLKPIQISRSKFGVKDDIDTYAEFNDFLKSITPVDLGLSSRWGDCNIGAVRPGFPGDKFAWGEVNTKDQYNWDNYQWGTNEYNINKYTQLDNQIIILEQEINMFGSPRSQVPSWAVILPFPPYVGFFGDGLGELDIEDDAANINVGNGWSIPSIQDFSELSRLCSWERATCDGSDGYKVTGPNGNSIFIPFVGLWSKELSSGCNFAARCFIINGGGKYETDYTRCSGLNVRPVYRGAKSISLNKTSIVMQCGDYENLIATISPSDAVNKSVTWSSSNPNVASVDDNGFVTAKSVGQTEVTVLAVDGGFTASCHVTVTEPLNLSLNGTANCYIVSKNGIYKFKAVQGNSDNAAGSIEGVKVLWESFGTDVAPSIGDLIKPDVSYADGYITFSTNDTYKEGNAVIAAYSDANCTEGNVLWSWHIWLTDRPEEQVYYNNAGTMMDRNLGATSARPGDDAAIGLYYQWGRKDPFHGAANIQSSKTAKASTTLPNPVDSSPITGTIDYSVKYPTTFIAYSHAGDARNFDWLYSTSTSADETRWQIDKTKYDPCPSGWKVPKGSIWSTALNSTSYAEGGPWNEGKYGMNFSLKFGESSDIWYPAADCISDYGFLYNSYRSGYYWSSTSADPCSARYLVFNKSNAYYHPYSMSTKALGYSVRCQKIQ